MNKKIHTSLTVAGSDCSGGAGIQADLKTFSALGIYGMSVITAVTAQNTLAVNDVRVLDTDFIKDQLDCVLFDIFPESVKIGMMSSSDICRITAEHLQYYGCGNIVCDPVMVSTSGSVLTSSDGVYGLEKYVFPISTIITPNIPEAQVLSKMTINNESDMVNACRIMYENYGCAILCKGGHLNDSSTDVFFNNGKAVFLTSKRINNENTHGTGCTLSSAIASFLALGYDLLHSVEKAKEYVNGAIGQMLDIGHGKGPLDHAYVYRDHVNKIY